MGNPIGAMPPEGETAALSPDVPSVSPDPIVAHHDAAKAVHDHTTYAITSLGEARKDLDKLVGMGDAVTDEDVLQSMAKWTANGADPKALIALMSGDPSKGQPPMPQGGEALKSWLAEHDQQMRATEERLKAAHQQAGQELGTAALRVLASDHMKQKMGRATIQMPAQAQAQAPAPEQSSNPLQ